MRDHEMLTNLLRILVEGFAANRTVVQAFATHPMLENALTVRMESPAVETTEVFLVANWDHSTASKFRVENLFGADTMGFQSHMFDLMYS